MSALLVSIVDPTGSDEIGTLMELPCEGDEIVDARVLIDRHHSTTRIRKCIGRDFVFLGKQILNASRGDILVYSNGDGWIGADMLRQFTDEGIVRWFRTWAYGSASDLRYWARLGKARDHMEEMLNSIPHDAPSLAFVEQALNDLVMLAREAKQANIENLEALLLCVKCSVGEAAGTLATKHDKAFRLV